MRLTLPDSFAKAMPQGAVRRTLYRARTLMLFKSRTADAKQHARARHGGDTSTLHALSDSTQLAVTSGQARSKRNCYGQSLAVDAL